MAFSRTIAGLAAFTVALGAAVLITKYYSAPAEQPSAPTAPLPVPTVEMPAPTSNRPGSTQVTFKLQMVTLDLGAGKSHTTLTVERDPAGPAPDRIWVRTYFFSTEAAGKVWSGEAVEVRQPFAGGSRTTVNVTAECPWCKDAGAPRAGYYARVVVSSESPEATRLTDDRVDTNISTAAPVVVQEGAKGRR